MADLIASRLSMTVWLVLGPSSNASGLQLLSSSLGGGTFGTAPKRRFEPPTLFVGKKRKGKSSGGRVTQYVRDIVCLPDEF